MRRLEPWIAGGFFVLLAGLEITHGVTRLESLRHARHHEIVDGAATALADLAASIRAKGSDGKRHAAYVARLPDAAALSRGVAKARESLTGQILAQMASFPEIDRVRVLSQTGHEVFRCERMGGGVAAIPEGLLSGQPDLVALDLAARLDFGGVGISDLYIDRERVEVPESERKVVHYVAKPVTADFPGFVVLTVYASPMFDEVRRFQPVPGSDSVLVTRRGDYVAARDRAREIGGDSPSSLLRDHPECGAILLGASRFESQGTHFLGAPTGDLPWSIVTRIPKAALSDATRKVTQDYWLVIAGMVGTLALLLVAAIVFHRTALRALRAREAEAALRQLEQRQEMERRLATAERLGSLGLLTAGVAHEINNPLEGIGNYLALLDRDDLAPDKRTRYLGAVRHGFERIRGVVQTLLGFARPGRAPGSADLRAVVDRAVELARFSKQCRDVTFAVNAGPHPAIVHGDEGALGQVLLNLFLNAGKAMDGRGRILVSIAREGDAFLVRVDDAGPGIAPDAIEKVFDPFFTTGEGSGLGLSVSYGIAKAHGGTLAAENLPGLGARFTLRLPDASAAAAASTERRIA